MALPFRTKASNLVFLNVFIILWSAGLIIGGIFAYRDALRTHSFGNLWGILGMLAVGALLYGVQRLFLSIVYYERPKATEADIAEARRMLYGPPQGKGDGRGQ